jgi:hypothetical protein
VSICFFIGGFILSFLSSETDSDDLFRIKTGSSGRGERGQAKAMEEELSPIAPRLP